jgi:hypothetical protein
MYLWLQNATYKKVMIERRNIKNKYCNSESYRLKIVEGEGRLRFNFIKYSNFESWQCKLYKINFHV